MLARREATCYYRGYKAFRTERAGLLGDISVPNVTVHLTARELERLITFIARADRR
jgi:hypothetical protein